jgi:hypothetical protein
MEKQILERRELILISMLIFLLIGFIVLAVTIHAYNRIIQIGKEIQICKDNGYDGAKFINKYTTEIECSNYTESEKILNNKTKESK